MLGALGDADWGVQLRAVQILRDRKVERSVPHMINMLSKCTPRVAESVAEALRDDDDFLYVAAWEFGGGDADGEMGPPVLHKEDLAYEAIELKQRSYK